MDFLLFYGGLLLLALVLIALASYATYRFAKAYLPYPAWTLLAWLPLLAVAGQRGYRWAAFDCLRAARLQAL